MPSDPLPLSPEPVTEAAKALLGQWWTGPDMPAALLAIEQEARTLARAEAWQPDGPVRALVMASRDRAGTCRFCNVPAYTFHDPDCPVDLVVRYYEPAYAAALSRLGERETVDTARDEGA